MDSGMQDPYRGGSVTFVGTDRGVSVKPADHPLFVSSSTPRSTQEGTPTSSPLVTPLAKKDGVRNSAQSVVEVGASNKNAHDDLFLSSEAFQERGVKDPSSDHPVPWPITAVFSARDWSLEPRLGFPPSRSEAVRAAEAEARPKLEILERKREEYWHKACVGVSLLASASPATIDLLRKGVRRHGIPAHLRGVLWLTLTGVALRIDENEYLCRALLRKHGYVQGDYGRAIEADLTRTFPGHPYFSPSGDVGLYKLKNVLHALCWRNPLLCYCQSFNYLAGFLLLVFDDEERCFWMLVHVLEVLLPNDFYSETLIGAKVDQQILCDLVKERLPRIADKFRAIEFEVEALFPAWVMSLFVNAFPFETVLRVWEYVLLEGSGKSDYRSQQRTSGHLEIVLATLKYHEDLILSHDEAGALMVALQEACSLLYDAQTLLEMARSLHIELDVLHMYRRCTKPLVALEIRQREERRAVLREQRAAEEERERRSQAMAAVAAIVSAKGEEHSPSPSRSPNGTLCEESEEEASEGGRKKGEEAVIAYQWSSPTAPPQDSASELMMEEMKERFCHC